MYRSKLPAGMMAVKHRKTEKRVVTTLFIGQKAQTALVLGDKCV